MHNQNDSKMSDQIMGKMTITYTFNQLELYFEKQSKCRNSNGDSSKWVQMPTNYLLFPLYGFIYTSERLGLY